MAKKRFPIIKGINTDYPKSAKCPWCKKNKVWEPHSFVCISGGALLHDKKMESAGPSDEMKGFLDFTWHGAHTNEGGTGKDPDSWAYLSLVRDATGGQFSFYFCSTQCLRAFLNSCVDELDEAIELNQDADV